MRAAPVGCLYCSSSSLTVHVFDVLWDADSIRHSAKAHEIAKRRREDRCFPLTDLPKDAAHRYSPAAVVAVSREIISGVLIDLGPFAA
jgi:hypothetical protein